MCSCASDFGLRSHLRVHLSPYNRQLHQCNVFVEIDGLPQASKQACVPATSAPVERVFSLGGLIMRPNRVRMGDALLEMLMHLSCSGN